MLKLSILQLKLPGAAVIVSSTRKFSSRKKVLEESRERVEKDKQNLQWRKDYVERGEWYSNFKLFANESENMDLMSALQQPRDVSIKGLKGWISDRKEELNKAMQGYIPERHEILGSDLAAAHFVVHRGGRVRFLGHKEWVKQDANEEYDLPKFYDEKYKIEAIDFEGMDLFYEGLQNVRRLSLMKYLSFKDVPRFDDWCLDRVSGSEFEALESLNLSGTKITYRGLGALYRVPSLRTLILDNPNSKEFELSLFMLQDVIPNLEFRYSD